MSELEDIFNAFDEYEDAKEDYILDEVNYKIKNPELLQTGPHARSNLRSVIKLGRKKIILFDKIRKFVSASQNRMTQNRMTQNRMTQNNPKLTIIESRRQNETQRRQRKEGPRKDRFNNSSSRKSIQL